MRSLISLEVHLDELSYVPRFFHMYAHSVDCICQQSYVSKENRRSCPSGSRFEPWVSCLQNHFQHLRASAAMASAMTCATRPIMTRSMPILVFLFLFQVSCGYYPSKYIGGWSWFVQLAISHPGRRWKRSNRPTLHTATPGFETQPR